MNNDILLDEKFAELTDRLLEGRQVAVPDELKAELEIVRKLDQMIAPRDAVPPALQMRLNQKINQEWDLHHRRGTTPQMGKTIFFSAWSLSNIAAAFALVIAIVLLAQVSGIGGGQLGFVDDSGENIAVVGGIVVVLGGGLLLYSWRQKR